MNQKTKTYTEPQGPENTLKLACGSLESITLKIQSLKGLAATLESGLRDNAIGGEDVNMLVTMMAQNIEAELTETLETLYQIPVH